MSQRMIHTFTGASVGRQLQLSNVYAVVHGHESGILLVLRSLTKGGAAEGEGVGFEEGWEEAGADVGVGL